MRLRLPAGSAISSRMKDDESQMNRELGMRDRIRRVIFHHERRSERLFDVILICCIALSVALVMIESVQPVRQRYGAVLYALEWMFTGLFTLEYILRIYVSRSRARYAGSFFGVVDLLSILPTYIDLFLPGARYLMLFRAVRVLRIFRILKMSQYVGESNELMKAVYASRRKITVFLFSVITLVLILGSVMYLIEGEENGFTSIPRSVYWAIVTLTTVGYGDVSPQTPIGQGVAAIVMILGYGIIAVPTGIVTAELTMVARDARNTRKCAQCGALGHAPEASFCSACGASLGEKRL